MSFLSQRLNAPVQLTAGQEIPDNVRDLVGAAPRATDKALLPPNTDPGLADDVNVGEEVGITSLVTTISLEGPDLPATPPPHTSMPLQKANTIPRASRIPKLAMLHRTSPVSSLTSASAASSSRPSLQTLRAANPGTSPHKPTTGRNTSPTKATSLHSSCIPKRRAYSTDAVISRTNVPHTGGDIKAGHKRGLRMDHGRDWNEKRRSISPLSLPPLLVNGRKLSAASRIPIAHAGLVRRTCVHSRSVAREDGVLKQMRTGANAIVPAVDESSPARMPLKIKKDRVAQSTSVDLLKTPAGSGHQLRIVAADDSLKIQSQPQPATNTKLATRSRTLELSKHCLAKSPLPPKLDVSCSPSSSPSLLSSSHQHLSDVPPCPGTDGTASASSKLGFDARIAESQCQVIEGYVSFASIQGLGIPPDLAHDDFAAATGKKERRRSLQELLVGFVGGVWLLGGKRKSCTQPVEDGGVK